MSLHLLMLFAHWVGLALWIGGEAAGFVVGAAGRREDPSIFGSVTRLRVAILRRVIAPGALVTLISGLVLTIERYYVATWLVIMQLAGFVGALLVLLIALPVGVRLSRIEPEGEAVAYFLQLRRRLSLIGGLSLALALLGLWAGLK